MSKIEVNAIEPQCGTDLTVGASGDTIIIPSGATISNQGIAAGFGPTGAVSWNTTKITADPNPAVSGVGYFADTTSAAFTITLPSSPSAGAVVGIADYANTFATNNLTVGRNSSNIGGVAANAVLSTNGVSVTFVYVDATQGWIVTDSGNRSDLPSPEYVAATGGTVTCCGDYKIHTFTGPGTFTVTNAGNPTGSTSVDYLVVAGGGGGTTGNTAGGGGAGGFREGYNPGSYTASPLATSALPITATAYPIVVGAGGSVPSAGTPSTFSTIISTGGGLGASGPTLPASSSGGSGGGGAGSSPAPKVAGSGNTPPVSPSQGNNGGAGAGTQPCNGSGGGGGGASAAGTPAGSAPGGNNTPGGAGGNGATTSISGSPTAYAGGGGGAGFSPGTPLVDAPGGTGGGGRGGKQPGPGAAYSTPGTINTGGGGGGWCGSGGSGIVIIRYKFQ